MSIFPLGNVFGSVAEQYDKARPPYSDELWDLLGTACDGLAGRLVLDVAAGTGMVTRPLTERGAHVVAVEPDLPLLAQLLRRSPATPAVRGLAEALPIVSACFDLVVCGTAWHWFDAGKAAAEVSRVLRSSGRVALFWANNRHDDSVEWEVAQSAVYDNWQAVPGSFAADPRLGVRPSEAATDLRSRGWSVEVENELFWTREVSRDEHLRMLGTHSVVLGLGAQAPAFLAAVDAALQPWPRLTQRLVSQVVVARPPV